MADGDRAARRALVLGASGFLGNPICQALAGAGFEVVGVARRRGPLDGVHRRVELDLVAGGPQALAELLQAERPGVVVNAAGCVRGDEAEMTRANVELVAHLLDAVTAAPRPARIVHLGSAAEYGLGSREARLAEDSPLRPVSPYGVGKARASRLLLGAFAAGTAEGAVLRVFNPIGPGAPPSSVLGRVAAELARQDGAAAPRVVVGPLGAWRDFVDVRDVAEAALLAATTPEAPRRALNVARGEAVCVREAVAMLVGIARPGAEVVEEGAGSSRSSGVDWQEADVRAAREALGWVPRRTLEVSLTDLWRQLTGHPMRARSERPARGASTRTSS
jgi:NDP-hexose 4-ketoreductase